MSDDRTGNESGSGGGSGSAAATPSEEASGAAARAAPDAVGSTAEEYRAVFQAAPDGILIVDEEGTIRAVNPAAEALFGYDAAEMIGREVEMLVPENLRAVHHRHREGYTEDPHARPMGVDLELKGRRKDGSTFPVEISLSPLETPGGLHVIGMIRDVSERKRLREFGVGALRAAEEERQRIARELHDDTAQRLAALLLRLELAERTAGQAERKQILDEVHDEILECVEGVRRIARGLRPPALEDAGVAVAIRSHVRAISAGTDIRTDLDVGPVDEHLDIHGKLVLYRIVQEALSNAIRHSDATRIHLRVSAEDGWVVATVEDDGRGFSVKKAMTAAGGLGLLGMRERAALVGGRVTIESERGGGTRVRVALPAGTSETASGSQRT